MPPVRHILFALMLLGIPAAILAAAPRPEPTLSATDQAAAFRSAGFSRTAGKWRACGDPGTASYTPGMIETTRDINGDGLLDAVITEGSVACFGDAGSGFVVVSKQANGSWRRITESPGIATFLARRTARGWPDLEIGGPGFCFAVERWNGTAYRPHRYQYEGKPCRPTH